MNATVNRRFTDLQERRTFEPNQTWTGTKARFDEINEKLKDRHKGATLEAIEEKPVKTTKQRKLKTETK